MKSYRLRWTHQAYKVFQKLDGSTQSRVRQALKELVRYYEEGEGKSVILVVGIKPRGNAYK